MKVQKHHLRPGEVWIRPANGKGETYHPDAARALAATIIETAAAAEAEIRPMHTVRHYPERHPVYHDTDHTMIYPWAVQQNSPDRRYPDRIVAWCKSSTEASILADELNARYDG